MLLVLCVRKQAVMCALLLRVVVCCVLSMCLLMFVMMCVFVLCQCVLCDSVRGLVMLCAVLCAVVWYVV